MSPDDYSYENAGFDGFLSRSIDQTPQVNLESQAIQTRQVAFDRAQVSGSLGDTWRIGRIHLNGAKGNIVINDGENDFFLAGEDSG